MEHHQSSTNEWAERHRDALTTHHSHEDVQNDREFGQLIEACRELPAPRGFQARFICLLGGRLGLRAGRSLTFRPPGSIRTVNSSGFPNTSPVTVGTASDRPAKKPPTPTSSPPIARSIPSGTRKQSRPPARFRSTCRYASSCALSDSPAGTRRSRGRARRSTDGFRRLLSRPSSPGGCIPTACAPPPPATTPPRVLRQCHYKR